MRILLVTEVFPPRKGGSGRWLYELYRRLPPGHVSVVAPDEPGAEAFDRTHDLPVRRFPFRFSSWGALNWRGAREYALALWRLNREVARVRPGVLHCGKAVPEGLLAWSLTRWRRLPYVCYVHGEELTLARTSQELGWMTRRALHGAAAVIANSQHTRGLLERDWGLPASKVHVMHPGVDATRFVPAPADPAVRARLGWGGRAVVLTVGALQKRKGQDTMIRALPRIKQQVPNILYSIAGEGWERGYLEGLIAELGLHDAVQMRGIPDDEELIQCYQQCDLFALPNRQVGSDFEGFGIVLLEAQACGKAVLAGASGGTVETMDPPHTGRVIPCDHPHPLAEEVVRLLSDHEALSRMGARGRQWVTSRLDWAPLTRQARLLFGITREQPSGPARYLENEPAGAP